MGVVGGCDAMMVGSRRGWCEASLQPGEGKLDSACGSSTSPGRGGGTYERAWMQRHRHRHQAWEWRNPCGLRPLPTAVVMLCRLLSRAGHDMTSCDEHRARGVCTPRWVPSPDAAVLWGCHRWLHAQGHACRAARAGKRRSARRRARRPQPAHRGVTRRPSAGICLGMPVRGGCGVDVCARGRCVHKGQAPDQGQAGLGVDLATCSLAHQGRRTDVLLVGALALLVPPAPPHAAPMQGWPAAAWALTCATRAASWRTPWR